MSQTSRLVTSKKAAAGARSLAFHEVHDKRWAKALLQKDRERPGTRLPPGRPWVLFLLFQRPGGALREVHPGHAQPARHWCFCPARGRARLSDRGLRFRSRGAAPAPGPRNDAAARALAWRRG